MKEKFNLRETLKGIGRSLAHDHPFKYGVDMEYYVRTRFPSQARINLKPIPYTEHLGVNFWQRTDVYIKRTGEECKRCPLYRNEEGILKCTGIDYWPDRWNNRIMAYAWLTSINKLSKDAVTNAITKNETPCSSHFKDDTVTHTK